MLSKLAFRAQTVESTDLPLRQDLFAKKRFNDRSKGFIFGQQPVETCNLKLLFDGQDFFLQFSVQLDLSPYPFAGMGYGPFTDSEMVPD